MASLSTLIDIRDVVVIVVGILGIVTLALSIVFTVLIGLATLKLIRAAKGTLREGVAPILEEVRGTATGVRGSTDFLAGTVIRPVIKVYGVFAGVRKGLGVVSKARGGKK